MNYQRICLVLALTISTCYSADSTADDASSIQTNDRIAVVGGTWVERLQQNGYFETALQSLAPNQNLTVRNLGWSGDNARAEARAVFGSPQDGYARLQRDLAAANPTVVVVGYGFAEAMNGLEAAERFPADLQRLLDDQAAAGVRVILLQPFHMPGVRTPDYDAAEKSVRQTIAQAAQERKLPLIDLAPWVSDADFDNGLHLTEQGYQQLGDRIARELLHQAAAPAIDYTTAKTKALRDKVIEKNQLFFHRYRPQNETYLFLFRKHEQGNNAVDIPRFDPLIEALDGEIHQVAAQ
ncbi:hypothetical protein Poly24_46310 [Rosistilla carotiformis]|uniref:SGNH hydrolase-type esterase domain-containing protein n=1 Tax=Rosistilla carotiformis TaxID=2528017 RepID=A0A518JZC5_9BACT|nr:GDSL-type esterase/lipase family protein [Rosistilla carotiformis]QDV70898.1 hypothetical protein Poly24_46310 [Rosistilla carotiformis]